MSHLLIVDDEPSICWGLAKLAEELGHQRRDGRVGRAGIGGGPPAAARPDRARRSAARHEWPRGHAAVSSGAWSAADHRHHGLWRLGHGRGSGSQRGVRVSLEAVRSGRGPAGDRAGRGKPLPAGGSCWPPPRRRGRRDDGRPLRGHSRGLQANRRGGALRRMRASARRERHGQGTGRPRHPPLQPAVGRAVRGRQRGLA